MTKNNPDKGFKQFKRFMALMLTAAFLLSNMPLALLAENEVSLGIGGVITAFAHMESEVLTQGVPLGTELQDLDLPEALLAFVEIPGIYTQISSKGLNLGETIIPAEAAYFNEYDNYGEFAENNGAQFYTQPAVPFDLPNTSFETAALEPVTMYVPVTWQAEPEFDGDAVGTYVFTATVHGGFIFAEGVELPEIVVTVLPMGFVATSTEITVTTEQELRDELGDGRTADVVRLGANMILDAALIVRRDVGYRDVTLDLNGFNLTVHGTVNILDHTLTIMDGSVGGSGILTANGNPAQAGIFVPAVGNSSHLIINSGTVIATGGNNNANDGPGAGIGGNGGPTQVANTPNTHGGTVTINGGTVVAVGGSTTAITLGAAAGIGGGRNASGGQVGSNSGNGGTVTINGGHVTATGGNASNAVARGGSGIGGSEGGNGGIVRINGGTVIATGGTHPDGQGRGIGHGYRAGSVGQVHIAGGTVIATGSERISGLQGDRWLNRVVLHNAAGQTVAITDVQQINFGGTLNFGGGTPTISGGTGFGTNDVRTNAQGALYLYLTTSATPELLFVQAGGNIFVVTYTRANNHDNEQTAAQLVQRTLRIERGLGAANVTTMELIRWPGEAVQIVEVHTDPAPGFRFDSWEVTLGSFTLSNPTQRELNIVMPDENTTIRAFFETIPFGITVSGGTVTPNPATVGQTVTVTADAPPSGQHFAGWTSSGPGVSFANASNASTTFVMPPNEVTVTANFAANVYGINLSASGTHNFGTMNFGYTIAPGALIVTVSNPNPPANQPTGPLTVALSGTHANSFALSVGNLDSIDVGVSRTFSINPVLGLNAGTHTATVTVSGSGASASFNVYFTVNQLSQTVGFPAQTATYGDAPITLNRAHIVGNAANLGTVTFAVEDAGTTGAVLNGDVLSFSGTGTAVIRISAAGTVNAAPATNTFMLTVNRATPTVSNLTFNIPTGHVFNGSGQGIGNVTGISGLGAITVLYNGSTDLPINAGTYSVTANISESANFNSAIGLVLGNYTIAKAPAPTGLTATRGVSHEGETGATHDISGLLPPNRGNTTYTIAGNTSGATGVAVSTAGVVSFNAAANATSGAISVNVTMQNFEDAVVTININIAQAYTTAITIPLVNGNPPAAVVTNPAPAVEGAVVNLPVITPNPGFEFVEWRVVSGGVTINHANSPTNASFVMGSQNVEITSVLRAAELPWNLVPGIIEFTAGQGVLVTSFAPGGSGDFEITITGQTPGLTIEVYNPGGGAIPSLRVTEDISGLVLGSFQITIRVVDRITGASVERAVTANVVPPVLMGTMAITASNQYFIGSVLTANTAGISGGVGVPSFVWQRAASSTGPWAAISGATSSTYTITGADAGQFLRVSVTYPLSTGTISSQISNTVPFSIVVVNAGNLTGDTPVTAMPDFGRVGDPITLNYVLGDGGGAITSLLRFTGATGLSNLSYAGESTSQIYTVTAGDAVNGVITITANFIHTDLLPQTLTFAQSGNRTVTLGSSGFTNAATGQGSGEITYSSSEPAVATVNNSGQVIIVGVGQTTITAVIEECAIYIAATASFVLTVEDATPTIPVSPRNDGGGENNQPASPRSYFANGNTFTLGSGANLALTINRDYSLFTGTRMTVNRTVKTLERDVDFGVTRGSTIITLYSEFLETLPAGWHTLEAVFTNGNVNIQFRVARAASQETEEDLGSGFIPEAGRHPFTDVRQSDWFNAYVTYMYINNLMSGTGDNIFNPSGTVSRAMVVQVLYNLENRPDVSVFINPFSDVDSNAWYTDAIIWAQASGILSGFGDGTFRPNDNMTRAHLAILLNNYAARMEMKLPILRDLVSFADDADIRNYAREAIELFFQAMIISGYPDGRFDPQGNATRAELATMLQRFAVAGALPDGTEYDED